MEGDGGLGQGELERDVMRCETRGEQRPDALTRNPGRRLRPTAHGCPDSRRAVARPRFTPASCPVVTPAPRLASRPPRPLPRVTRGLAVAVRAEEHEVLEPVVVAAPVHVMDLEAQRETSPRIDAAALATTVLQSRVDQPRFEARTMRLSPGHKQILDPSSTAAGDLPMLSCDHLYSPLPMPGGVAAARQVLALEAGVRIPARQSRLGWLCTNACS